MPLTRLALRLIFPFVFIFPVLVMSTQTLGRLQSANAALRGFTEGCQNRPQPCWYGIVPGVTTAGEAAFILEGLGYHNFNQSDTSYPLSFKRDDPKLPRVDFEAACQDSIYDRCRASLVLWVVVFSGLSDLTVGDVILALGEPVSIGFNSVSGPAIFYNQLTIGCKIGFFLITISRASSFMFPFRL